MTTATLPAKPQSSAIQLPSVDAVDVETLPVKIRLPEAVIAAGPDACANWFWEVCFANEETCWQMELTADGVLELMPPTYDPSDVQENRASSEVYLWDREQNFPGMPTGPHLWVSVGQRRSTRSRRGRGQRWKMSRVRQPGEPGGRPYCPDFVVEIRSTSQSRPSGLNELLEKMREYMDNGVRLGWLIDPMERTVRIYRGRGCPNRNCCKTLRSLDGEDVLARLHLRRAATDF